MSTAPATHRIDTASAGFARALTGLALVILTVAFAISAAALVEVAAWANVAYWLRWGFAVLVDAAALLLIGVALKSRSEGYAGRTRFCWTGVAFLTLTSSALNGAHAADGDAQGWRLYAGIGMAVLPPILVWLACHILAWVHAATPEEIAARQAAAEKAAEDARARAERDAERDARHQAKLARIAAEADARARIDAAELHATITAKVAAAEAAERQAVQAAAATATASPVEATPAPARAPVDAEQDAPAPPAPPAAPPAPEGRALSKAEQKEEVLRLKAEQEEEVLRLLAEGMADAAIARLPGMPSRTTVGRIRERAEAATSQPTGDAPATLELVSA